MVGYTLSEIIGTKQKNQCLDKDQIQWVINSILDKSAHDAQIGAFLMAIYWQGMNIAETISLTSIMKNSGEVLIWPEEWKHLVVDKHSTGGVGDKVSLVLAPALAACGLKVPMISGRSLGFTGGTLDKLESIPGYNVNVTSEEILKIVDEVGCCIVGQTQKLVPADKILYGLRDITSTVASQPLICSSIISKKAAEGLTNLVLDVKYGRGSWQNTSKDAEDLAKILVAVGNGVGVKTIAITTSMEEPLGNTVGNSLEVIESVHCLQGNGPDDVMEIVAVIGGELLFEKGLATSAKCGKKMILKSIDDQHAIDVFKRMLIAQGVDGNLAHGVCTNPEQFLPLSSYNTILKSPKTGVVTGIDPLACAEVSCSLGAGRNYPGDPVTHDTGIHLIKKVGSKVLEGEVWAKVHHVDKAMPKDLVFKLEKALEVNTENTSLQGAKQSKVGKIIRESLEN